MVLEEKGFIILLKEVVIIFVIVKFKLFKNRIKNNL